MHAINEIHIYYAPLPEHHPVSFRHPLAGMIGTVIHTTVNFHFGNRQDQVGTIRHNPNDRFAQNFRCDHQGITAEKGAIETVVQ